MGYDAVNSDNYLSKFRDNVSAPSSNVKNPKRCRLGFFRKYSWTSGVSTGVVSGASIEVYDARVGKDHYFCYFKFLPISVAARPKAWLYGRSLAGIVGSNPADGMDVCVECCVLSDRGLCDGADHSSRGVLPNVMRRVV